VLGDAGPDVTFADKIDGLPSAPGANADTWAYFAADCAKVLSESDISRAMKGI
jgi:hypothetical protein